MMIPIAAALFDVDGTLVDSNDFHVSAWREAFQESSHEFSRDALHDHIGKGADNFIPALLPDASRAERKRLESRHADIFRRNYLSKVKAFRHAKDCIEAFHAAGARVVIASSASADEVDHYIDLLQIRAAVTASTSADEVERSKPAGDIFFSALAKAGAPPPAQTLVIGDTPYDAAAARKANLPMIAVRSGRFDETILRSSGARWVCEDIDAVLAWARDNGFQLPT